MTFSFARSCLDVIANDSSPDCGISREVESDKRRFRSRIVGGGDVSEGEIPWQVGFDFFKFCHGADLITLNIFNTGRFVGVWRPREALVWRCPCFLQVREQIGRNILTYIGKWTNHYILSFFKNLSRANFYDHRHVLTAGHCIMGRPITTLAVALGFTDLKQTVGEKLTKINKIIKDLVKTMLSVLERCLQEMVA